MPRAMLPQRRHAACWGDDERDKVYVHAPLWRVRYNTSGSSRLLNIGAVVVIRPGLIYTAGKSIFAYTTATSGFNIVGPNYHCSKPAGQCRYESPNSAQQKHQVLHGRSMARCGFNPSEPGATMLVITATDSRVNNKYKRMARGRGIRLRMSIKSGRAPVNKGVEIELGT